MISLRIAEIYSVSTNIQFLVSALVAAITVSGKALGKSIANNKSTQIVHAVGVFLDKIKIKK